MSNHADSKPPVVIDLMAALRAKLDSLPTCQRCNRKSSRIVYCAGCDRGMCDYCQRDHVEHAK